MSNITALPRRNPAQGHHAPAAFSHEAERAVCAALIRQGADAAADNILHHGISADLFCNDATQALFTAICNHIADGIPIDLATLNHSMNGAVKIEYETSLTDNASAANLLTYVKVLKDLRTAREMKALRDKLSKAAQSDVPPHELAAIVESMQHIGQTQRSNQDWISADQLLMQQFPVPVWLLADLLPEIGAFLLCGKPKAGKSWLALQLGMAVAQGGRALDRDVPAGGVIYLALEDNLRRLQTRIKTLQPDADRNPASLANLHFKITAPTLANGLEAELRQLIASAKTKVRLVIVDTLQKVRGAGGSGNQYGLDYEAVGRLKRIADDAGICLLIVHHIRKMEADDAQDAISGTNGIAGAADGSLVLLRQRASDAAVLHVTGRDMPDAEFGLRFNKGTWEFAGDAATVRASAEQNALLKLLAGYGEEGATAAMLAEESGKKAPAIRFLLRKMNEAGLVRVRQTKPAPHYAVTLSPSSTTYTPPNDEDEGLLEWDEKPLTPLTPLTALTPLTPLTPLEGSAVSGHEPPLNDGAVSGVSLESASTEQPDQHVKQQIEVSAVSGVSGVSAISENAETASDVGESAVSAVVEGGSDASAVSAVSAVSGSDVVNGSAVSAVVLDAIDRKLIAAMKPAGCSRKDLYKVAGVDEPDADRDQRIGKLLTAGYIGRCNGKLAPGHKAAP